MEAQRRGRREDNKRVMLPRVGGGGLETLVVWGGALAVAGLVGAFSIKKMRNNVSEETVNYNISNGSCQKEDEKSDGLRFVLQSSSPAVSLNTCSASCDTSKVGVAQIDNCTTEILIDMVNFLFNFPQVSHCDIYGWSVDFLSMEFQESTEQKHASSGEHQEIPLSDSDKESIVISDDGDGDGDGEEEFSFPVLEDAVVDKPEQIINVGSEASLMVEAVDVNIEEGAATAEEMTEQDLAEQTSFSSASLMEEDETAATAEEETSEQSPSSTEEEEEESNIKPPLLGEKEENHSPIQPSFSSSDGEEYSPNQSASTEEDVTEEESTDSSEESGSSTETSEAIWPAEVIDTSSAEHRKTIINYQNSGESFGQRDTNTTQIQELLSYSQQSSDCYMLSQDNRNAESSRMINNNKAAQELVVVVHNGKHLIRWQIALCSVVLPLLLLLIANLIITPKYFF